MPRPKQISLSLRMPTSMPDKQEAVATAVIDQIMMFCKILFREKSKFY